MTQAVSGSCDLKHTDQQLETTTSHSSCLNPEALWMTAAVATNIENKITPIYSGISTQKLNKTQWSQCLIFKCNKNFSEALA